MDTMINESGMTFKDLEKIIFSSLCEAGQDFLKEILKQYDRYLAENRDKAAYRHKGFRHTTVKTVFGEVGYDRAVYQVTDENGTRSFEYLLDKVLQIGEAGLLSQNFAEKLVSGITIKSYRDCARELSETTGQSISAMGVWNAVQKLGGEACEQEKKLAEAHRRELVHGSRETAVLFEEIDGVNIRLQGKDRKENPSGKAEMKVAIAYDGFRKTGKDRYSLSHKVVFAGFAGSKEFHKIREAKIAAEYNLDEVRIRLLNGDGAAWIKKIPDKETVFQLDPYHRNAAIKENIAHPEAREAVREYLCNGDTEGMFRYLAIYRDSLEDEKNAEKAEKLIQYFSGNAEGLMAYQGRVTMPESPEGIEYRNMGTMENHVWSIVASRMKHGHRTWSRNGADHLAKILAKKSEGRLYEITDRLGSQVFEEEKAEEILEGLSVAKASGKDGHGYEYPVQGSIVGLKSAVRGSFATWKCIAGY